MSALGHEQTSRHVCVMSVIPLKADSNGRGLHVRLVPQADIAQNERRCSLADSLVKPKRGNVSAPATSAVPR